MTQSSLLIKEVRRLKRLESAWKRVRDNGRKSRSKRTRAEVDDFSAEIHSHLRSIQGQLTRPDSFQFEPSRGWAEPPKESGKKHRPIVITPVKSRIVQRAILDVLLDQSAVQDLINNPNSFGGVQKKDPDAVAAVPGAIGAAASAIRSNNLFYTRSDISGFFRHIPKSIVLGEINGRLQDGLFDRLLTKAIDVELANLDEISQHRELFPKEDIGVAQGCSLSPLMGNILLAEFDKDLNSGPCVCIRYIDDFLILGPTRELVDECFAIALRHLDQFSLTAYDPLMRPDKAERGHVDEEGMTFLGVEINNRSVRPSKKNRGKLLESVKEIIDEHTNKIPHEDYVKSWNYEKSFLRCLFTVNAVVAGWGNQYYFCNDRKIMNDLDEKISALLANGYKKFRSMWGGLGYLGRRRLMGVRSLHDCKFEPLSLS